MDIKELLEGIENTDEIIEKINKNAETKGIKLIFDNAKESGFIPKNRFTEVVEQKNAFKTQSEELNKQIEEFKNASKGNEDFTKKIEELQKINKDWEDKYKDSQITNTIKLNAVQKKARDANDILSFIDKSKIEFNENGELKGLNEQFENLISNKSYLFDTGNNIPQSSGINPSNGQAKTFTRAEIDSMTPQQISENWDVISNLMRQSKI